MHKGVSEAIKIAEREGLTVVECNKGAKHFLLRLRARNGGEYVHPISLGTRGNSLSDRQTLNMRAAFRRLARGDKNE